MLHGQLNAGRADWVFIQLQDQDCRKCRAKRVRFGVDAGVEVVVMFCFVLGRANKWMMTRSVGSLCFLVEGARFAPP
jgi:hypothetical protein